jgi:hypothetical protein
MGYRLIVHIQKNHVIDTFPPGPKAQEYIVDLVLTLLKERRQGEKNKQDT